MAKDYGEMEREFIAGLKEDTGRDLAEWMSVIGAQGFSDKNDAIDWLRQQGFLFNRASWLERIHANGGKPLYGDRPVAVSRKRTTEAGGPVEQKPTAETAAAKPAPSAEEDERLQALIAQAKGYQPLYRVLTAAIERAVPGIRVAASDGYISIGRPAEFAGIEPNPKGLRLALALGDRPFQAPLQPTRQSGSGKQLTHMLVLDDARRIDLALIDLVKIADARVNG
jgi:hypothetical protein